MSSIGPQLPPHLQKRKRTPENDDEEPNSPPTKAIRRDNKDEIALDESESDDDGFGPGAPAPTRPSIGPSLPPQPQPVANPSIGPSLPPSTTTTTTTTNNADEIALDSDSDSDVAGPAPPSNIKRVHGPAPPPALLSSRPTASSDPDPNPNPNSDSDSDEDDWGPALPGSTPSHSSSNNPAVSGPSLPSSSTSQAPQRDSWMVAPPTSSGYKVTDTTKLKSRKFASGPRASTSTPASGSGVSSIWTETPEEKARRLANAVLGREDPNNAPHPTAAAAAGRSEKQGKIARSEEEEVRIRSYVDQTRGKSLVEEHQARKAEAKTKAKGKGGQSYDDGDDDPSKRAFDWEKDMKVGGSISGAQKRQLLSKAANFGGRFEKGNYL